MASVMNESAPWYPSTRSQKKDQEIKIEQWWEVKRSQNPADPAPVRGATPLVERCMRVHGFSEGFSIRVLKGYRQFMELKSVMNDWNETKLAASVPINQMWELHLMDNLNYTEDCLTLFGRVVGHNPDAILNLPALKERILTTKIAFQARYGDDIDEDVWDFGDDDVGPSIKENRQETATMSQRGRLGMAYVSREEDVNPATTSVPKPSPAKSPSTLGGNEPITIFLRDAKTGEETYFSLRYKSTLRIVFTVYAERRGLNQESLKFKFASQDLTGYETPHSLALEDRARIDVHATE